MGTIVQVELPTLEYEQHLFTNGTDLVVGIDEVGRGCVAGPVVCGAVAISTTSGHPPNGLADSKLIPVRRREGLVEPIKMWSANWALGWATPAQVDKLGIMGALTIASRQALAGLALAPATKVTVILDGHFDYIKIDEIIPPPLNITVTTVIKADMRCASVAGASVLAKVARDKFMAEQALRYPSYGFERHVGYLTAQHKQALSANGPCAIHRFSFAGVAPGSNPDSRNAQRSCTSQPHSG